ncbi:DUF58 domain-containing protein [Sutcliffiella rhizosphaerae]|uniref:DUF58 domain-containing protein n=1 Tax=Sutcliffiella rhizosphaerae TaxID=2880967 RepID=A0ABN8AC52_9BACI|nr:DUF58 domain-containing protein [Sutcliffiella rhizosphaerae]CAG9622084.1 hypothetical protein BACCIP111883_02875 [Sutcliffiella rhizosphaerae]
MVIGTRDYQNGDSFGQIHWKATARTNHLQSKVYERTSQLTWLFIIDIHTVDLEEKLRGVAYLLRYATKQSISYSILVNIKKFGKPSYIELNIGGGKQQFQAALLLLARIKVENVIIPPSMFTKIVHQHAPSFAYAFICAEQRVYEKWELQIDAYLIEFVSRMGKLKDIPKKTKKKYEGEVPIRYPLFIF